VKVAQVLHLEKFGDKRATLRQHLVRNDYCRLQKLRLQVLVDFVEASHIGSAIRHHKIRFVTFKHA
jgi:hypothetical protein